MNTWYIFVMAAAMYAEYVYSSYAGHYAYHGPVAIPHVQHDGFLSDTHEVAAAKHAHLAALAKASSHHGGYSGEHGVAEYGGTYHGPIAIPKVLPDGHIADTHEVAAAKSAHLAALAKAKSAWSGQYSSGYYGAGYHGDDYASAGYHGVEYNKPYHGPLAKPVVLHSGYLADTHEVAAAKGAHINALHKAEQQATIWESHDHHY